MTYIKTSRSEKEVLSAGEWLIQMLRKGRDPIDSVERQVKRMGGSKQAALNILVVAAQPNEKDDARDAILKRSFVKRAATHKSTYSRFERSLFDGR